MISGKFTGKEIYEKLQPEIEKSIYGYAIISGIIKDKIIHKAELIQGDLYIFCTDSKSTPYAFKILKNSNTKYDVNMEIL
jgi:hypothetical protein